MRPQSASSGATVCPIASRHEGSLRPTLVSGWRGWNWSRLSPPSPAYRPAPDHAGSRIPVEESNTLEVDQASERVNLELIRKDAVVDEAAIPQGTYYTAAELAERLQVSKQTLHLAIQEHARGGSHRRATARCGRYSVLRAGRGGYQEVEGSSPKRTTADDRQRLKASGSTEAARVFVRSCGS